jgi:hypothetical protein
MVLMAQMAHLLGRLSNQSVKRPVKSVKKAKHVAASPITTSDFKMKQKICYDHFVIVLSTLSKFRRFVQAGGSTIE